MKSADPKRRVALPILLLSAAAILLYLLIVMLTPAAIEAQSAITLGINPSQSEIDLGESIEVVIEIDLGSRSFGTGAFTLLFDSAIVSVDNVVHSSSGAFVFSNLVSPGEMRFNTTYTSEESGVVEVATVTLRGLNYGDSDLETICT